MKEEMDKNYEKHISPTQLRTYIICGKKYYYRYVQGIKPEAVHYSVIFGRAFHQTVAEINIYRKQKKQVESGMAFNWFKEFFDREIEFSESEINFVNATETGLINTANIMLNRYITYLSTLKTDVLNIEYGVSYPVEGTDYVFEGMIDSIERDNNRVYLVEVKTASRMWSEEMVKFDLQAPLYKNAISMLFPDDEIVLRYDIITRGMNVKLESKFNITTDKTYQNMMREIISGIEKGVFTPRIGYQCKGCEYEKRCWEGLIWRGQDLQGMDIRVSR
jgi:CRISPR/Cas system-associated exonuclease Cas4 (RecB family)